MLPYQTGRRLSIFARMQVLSAAPHILITWDVASAEWPAVLEASRIICCKFKRHLKLKPQRSRERRLHVKPCCRRQRAVSLVKRQNFQDIWGSSAYSAVLLNLQHTIQRQGWHRLGSTLSHTDDRNEQASPALSNTITRVQEASNGTCVMQQLAA